MKARTKILMTKEKFHQSIREPVKQERDMILFGTRGIGETE
jgi:hypothetical protein